MSNFFNELKSYQSIPRELVFDQTLSDRARFVYVFMACKPEGWDFFLEPMAKEIKYSVDTLRKYISELVASGWLEKGEQENGRFGATSYTLKATKITDTEIFRHGKNTTQDNIDNIITDKREKKDKNKEENSKKEESDLVERIYKMYPTRCPKRNTSLGKSSKDKERIKKLLKTYSFENVERVIEHEIEEKYGKSYMQNFSTFLNNFPDPCEIFGEDKPTANSHQETKPNVDNLVVNGQTYR